MSETPQDVTAPEISDDEIQSFIDGGEEPSYHPILEVWREVLKPAAEEAKKKVTPQWASRIIASYSGLYFSDMNEVRDRYFGKIAELAKILDLEIATDGDCLSYATPEDDALENAVHYKNLLMDWQRQFLWWELEWDCTDKFAAAELAAISEVHKMFFGQTGLTQFLDNIQFEYTEADQADLAAALESLRGEG